MKRRTLLSGAAGLATLAACSTTNPKVSGNPASQRASIDAGVGASLSKLEAQIPGSAALLRRAHGVLVFPSVVSAGFGVGGSYGQGALRAGGRSVGYYSTTALSVGLLAGADSKAIYILFMTEEALARFRASKGWTAGVDASVSVLTAGADVGIDTQTAQQPVIGYVLTNAGLMANAAFDGTKITKLDL